MDGLDSVLRVASSPGTTLNLMKPLVAIACALCALSQAVALERPNVLFIAIDDLNGWIGAFGEHPQAKTPHIDRLAARGVLFSNAHCAAPACNPSRKAVMTGLRPSTSGVYVNQQDWRESKRLKDVITLPEHFRNHGYETRGGGKLYHAASLNVKGFTGLLDAEPWDEFFPSKEKQLADEVVPDEFPSNGISEFYKGFFDWAALEIEDAEMGDGKVVAWAEEQLTQERDEPIFLAVGIYRPHIPFYTPRSYFDEHGSADDIVLPRIAEDDLGDVPEAGQSMARRNWHEWMMEEEGRWREFVRAYLASATFADAMVGRLMDALDQGPMRDNTVVVLWSDHGYHLGHKEHWEKFALWRQASRVPLIFAGPGIEGGGVCDRPASLLDIYPTLIELCGLGDGGRLDGESLFPFLSEPGADEDRMVVVTHGPGNHAVQSRDWRYIRYKDGSEELYDHRSDPDEFTNLAPLPEHRNVMDEHAAALPTVEEPMDPVPSMRTKK